MDREGSGARTSDLRGDQRSHSPSFYGTLVHAPVICGVTKGVICCSVAVAGWVQAPVICGVTKGMPCPLVV